MTTLHNRQRMRAEEDDLNCAAGVIRAVILGLLIWAAGALSLCIVLG